MCRADVAIMTYDWRPELSVKKPWPNFEVEHECASFEAVDEWARKHQPGEGVRYAGIEGDEDGKRRVG